MILSTRENLVKRSIIHGPKCPICQREVESVSHVLWSCTTATNVWTEELSPVRKWISTLVNMFCLWGETA